MAALHRQAHARCRSFRLRRRALGLGRWQRAVLRICVHGFLPRAARVVVVKVWVLGDVCRRWHCAASAVCGRGPCLKRPHVLGVDVCTSRAQENCTGLGMAVLKYHQGRNTGGCMDGCAADHSAGCGTPL